MKNEEWIKETLDKISKNSLERQLISYDHSKRRGIILDHKAYINFSSNNYLNLATNNKVITYAQNYLNKYGTSAKASRLVTGTMQYHTDLEKYLAEFKGYPSALLFSCGFLTNIGVITSLLNSNDHIFSDRLNHASIIDAIKLSKVHLHRFNHNDPDHLKNMLQRCPLGGKRMVITESVFSMDGDIAPLASIAEISQQYNAMLMVDEAHSTGIFGKGGRGIVNELGIEPLVNVAMGTFSKGLGGYGGFVTCSHELRRLLINKARSFIYTTALPPAVIGSILGALKVLKENPDLGKKLLKNAQYFRNKLKKAGLNTGDSKSQIIPLIIGDAKKTLALSQRLKDNGILAIAIRPPSVPDKTSRIRLSVTLNHSKEILERTAKMIIESANEEGII